MLLDFLKKVLPEGLVVIAKPGSKGFVQEVCADLESAAAMAAKFDAQGKDCYFGLGSLIAPFQIRESDGKKEIRVGTNISQFKCLFLDLDVEAGNEKKYASQADAILALKGFCKDEQFPAPLIVNSGGGIHAYWPFDEPISAYDWRELAQVFKSALAEYGLKADPVVTADSSRVLRVVGTHNYKNGMKRPVEILRNAEPYTVQEIKDAVARLAEKYKVSTVVRVPRAVAPESILGSNTDTNIPETPNEIARVQAILDATDANCDYEQWRNTIWGLADLKWECGLAMAVAWSLTSVGPKRHGLEYIQTLYDKFDPAGGITARSLFHLAPTSVPDPVIVVDPVTGVTTTVPAPVYKPPFPYGLDEKGQIILRPPEKPVEVIYKYEIRPVRRTRSERDNVDSVTWEVYHPKTGWKEFSMKQSLLARLDAFHAALFDISIIVNPTQLKLLVGFMSAYIKQLQNEAQIEQLFSRVGWRDDNTKFVYGDIIFNRDGTSTTHRLSEEIKAEIPGLCRHGDLDGWKQAIQFYNAPDHEAHRFLLYCGFGAPLLHMTGHKGVLVNGSGDSGAGKTTVISAAASIYGHPIDFLINGTKGGTTNNALYAKLAAYNNLPFGLDEITLIDPKVLGEFAMQVNQGTGKTRLIRTGAISTLVQTWATIVLTSANTDIYATLSQSRADAGAEAMRVLQIPFDTPSSRSKIEADAFLRELKDHHGVAGIVFLQYITENYEVIKTRIIAAVQAVDSQAHITAAERFWSGAIASAYVGALAARYLGLLENFPVEKDIEWVIRKLSVSRKSLKDEISSPRELFSEYLEARLASTLVVTQTLKANVAPRIEQLPRNSLTIRHEVDAQRMLIMKSDFKDFCKEMGGNYGAVQADLITRKILLNANKQVILGKGTDLSKGQVRCWEIDLKQLQEGN